MKSSSNFSVGVTIKGVTICEVLEQCLANHRDTTISSFFFAIGAISVYAPVCTDAGLVPLCGGILRLSRVQDLVSDWELSLLLESYHTPNLTDAGVCSHKDGCRQIKRCRQCIINPSFLLDRKAHSHNRAGGRVLPLHEGECRAFWKGVSGLGTRTRWDQKKSSI